MKTKLKNWTVEKMIRMRGKNALRINAEYQRGAIWKENQMRLLADSILRGYRIPLIYLRHVVDEDEGMRNEYYDIIDGQQRINALRSFESGTIFEDSRSGDQARRPLKPLFNPADEKDKDNFPVSLQRGDCAWGGKKFENLSDDIKKEFLNTEIPVALIEECDDDEARDLFIRLQGGSDLKAQEKRDAWPGNFCQIILKYGGKPQMSLPGHEFFLRVMNGKPASDRGETRQRAAQLLMLLLEQKERGRDYYVSTKTQVLDDCYRKYAGISLESPHVLRFREILDKLASLFADGKRKPLLGHDAIHLVLFVDMLMDNYSDKWEDGIVAAFDVFQEKIREAKKHKDLPVDKDQDFQDVWTYNLKTRTNSDYPATIKQRHEIYMRLMLQFLGDNAAEKDAQRGFTPLQRETIYFRDKKKCHVCKQDVKWEDADIHHIKQHSEGGETTLENGVLVHRKCHRKLHKQKGGASDD